jgi:type II secretory pathway pseudopilin PulG
MHIRRRSGAALLDLFVVIGIIAVLVSIVIPMLMTARYRAKRAKCADNLRGIGLALRYYAGDNKGRLPATRPTTGPVVIPDVSNSGFDAPDPFSPEGPRPNNIPAVFFLLMRTQNLSSAMFICPNTLAEADRFAGRGLRQRSNFTDLRRNLSYAVQNPYANDSAIASGFQWTVSLPDSFAVVADKGPRPVSDDILSIIPFSPSDRLRLANSPNHERTGQNVLYADGRVEFQDTPFAGVDRDNIYRTRDREILNSPRDGTDSILLPADD